MNNYFYIISYPRSGNTWTVNSLKDYLGAQRAELMPSVYGGDVAKLNNNNQVKFAGKYNTDLPVGIKTHMYYSQFAKAGLPAGRVLYLVRDARDVMVSYYFYLNGFLKQDVDKAENFDPSDFKNHLRKRLPEYQNHVVEWKNYHGEINTVKYEDLKISYIDTLQRIKGFLHLDQIASAEEVKDKYVDNFSGIDNFNNVLQGNNLDFYRKGIVGDWLNHFNEEHKDVVKEEIGDLLIDLGYEKDQNW